MRARRHSFRRNSWRRWVLGGTVVMFLLARVVYDHHWNGSTVSRRLPLREGLYSVVSVTDGVTLVVSRQAAGGAGSESARPACVRLLGVDCGETTKSTGDSKAWTVESLAFTQQFVAGHKVRLRFDKRRIDQSGRYLAYVFVDDQLLNEALVRAGLARVSTYPGDSLSVVRRLRVAEQEAREQMRGMWSLERH